jgi:hypothetical protein
MQQKERVMPRTSLSRTPKRQRASPRSAKTSAVAARRSTAAKHKALRATKVDPVLTQELAGAPVPAVILAAHASPFLPPVEFLGFAHRAASTFLTLPLAMMRCRTPLEVWEEQNKLLQDVFADFQKVSSRVVSGALKGASRARDTKVKKRRQGARLLDSH